ncbi:hypothetical protein [Micromonospora sp. NPDC049679]|uniref:hypothetical protein n=1 Tax=Micromonospora sp. NPDC049679 TaxID=3155920 RepID=UPI0033FBAC00
MSARHGGGRDGIWRIGPVRLLTAVVLGYLSLVLVLTVLKLDLIRPDSVVPNPGTGATGAAPDLPGSPATEDPGFPTPTVPVPAPSPATPSVVPTGTPPPPPPPPRPTAATTPPARSVVTAYEAESAGNGLAGTRTFNCPGCSGRKKVGNIGRDMGALRINGVTARTGGPAVVTLGYVNGEGTRAAQLSVNGGPPLSLSFPGTGGWSTSGALVVTVTLRAGANTLTLFNPSAAAPDFDNITVRVPAR